MNKKIKKVFFILFCVLISCVLFGCKKETIKFYRESKVQSLMDNFQNQNNLNGKKKDAVKKSSGVILYKDNSGSSNDYKNTHFGPKDLDFDLPIK